MVERDFGSLDTRRVIEPRSKIQDEVVVEFPTSAIRDSVKSCGYRLEGMAAGIKIEIPAFLKSDFHVLQNLAFKMKQANKEAKRSVKFDDDCYGLISMSSSLARTGAGYGPGKRVKQGEMTPPLRLALWKCPRI